MGVDELHSHRTFADCRGAALGRAGADVSGREHAGNVGLEQVVAVCCCAGEDEAVVVAGHRVVEPLGAGSAPRKRNRNENGSRSPLFNVTASSLPSSPCRAAISLRSRTATP